MAPKRARRMAGLLKGGCEVIGPHHFGAAGGVLHGDLHLGVLAHQRHQVVGEVFPPILLAALHGGGGGGGVGDGGPFDTVEMGDFGAGGPVWRAAFAGAVFVEAGIDVAGALEPFIGEVAIGAAADDFGDLLERIGVGQSLRHHRGHGGADFAQRIRQQREGAAQAELDGAVVGRGEFVRGLDEGIADRRLAWPSA